MKKGKRRMYVPEAHGDALRRAIGDTGAGVIGKYSHCSFTIKRTSRFRPEPGSDSTEGEPGKLEEITEDRIEMVCEGENPKAVLAAIRSVHPYAEPATDVYPIKLT